MHDPQTVICTISSPFTNKGGYYLPFATIFHKDPCTDGTDDSCGWFMRARHCNQKKLEEIKKEFAFNLKNNYWFDKEGYQKFSTIGILVQMYKTAAWIHFGRNRKKTNRFMNKYLYQIIDFAENDCDSGGDGIRSGYLPKKSEDFIPFAGMVYSDICRKLRPWYKHPKWHIYHWTISWNFTHWWWFRKKSESPKEEVVDQNLRDTV